MSKQLKTKLIWETSISILLLIFYVLFYCIADEYVVPTLSLSFDPAIFPKAILLCTSIACAILVVDCFFMLRQYAKGNITPAMQDFIGENEAVSLGIVCAYIGVLFLYLIGLYFIGFLYTTPFILIIVSLMLGLKRIMIGAIAAILFTVALEYAALHYLQIILPIGTLFSA